MSRYLYAYCNLREDFRFFKLSRMKDISVTDKHFEKKITGTVFQADNVFVEEYVTLKMKIDPTMAYRVYDEFDNYVKQNDGSFIVQTIYPRGEWLFPYIASFGRYCQVLEPLDIRSSVKEELEKAMNNYS